MVTKDRTHGRLWLCWVLLFFVPAREASGWEVDRLGIAEAREGSGAAEIQTLEDIERIGTAAFAWYIDQLAHRAPALGMDSASEDTGYEGAGDGVDRDARPGDAALGVPIFDMHDVPVITATDLETLLVPGYLDALPTTDGWGGPYEFRLDRSMVFQLPAVAIRSAGANRTYSGTTYSPGFTSDAEGDIVWVDRLFVRRPVPSAAEAADYTAGILEQISLAAISWRTDQVGGVAGTSESIFGLTGCEGHQVDISTVPVTTADALEARLAPGYLTFLPRMDGWQNALDFRFDDNLALSSGWLAVRSAGSDGTFKSNLYIAGFTTADTEDLVTFDEFAIRRPPAIGREQEESLSEIQLLGTVIFSWAVDNGFQTPAPTIVGSPPFDIGDLEPITHQDLESLLVPFYIPCLPKKDFWGFDYDFWVDVMNPFAILFAGIRSRGSDGIAEGPIYTPGPFPGASTEQDLLWVDGVFLRFPEADLIFFDGFESGDTSAWSS